MSLRLLSIATLESLLPDMQIKYFHFLCNTIVRKCKFNFIKLTVPLFCSITVWCANPAHNEQSHKTPFVFIKGCFAGGIYLALWFTILQQPDKTKPEDQVLAVLAVFPIVSRLTD